MCAPGCIEHLAANLSRRNFIATAAGLASIGTAGAAALTPDPAAAQRAPRRRSRASRAIDLTHTLTPEFPTFDGKPGIALSPLAEIRKDGYNMMQWTVREHSGTHIDAPIHFSKEGPGPAELTADNLVVPLAVIDVAAKAKKNADYQLTPADVRGWEKRNGRLPRNACLAMYSGWEQHLASPRYAGSDTAGIMHFPGIHPDTIAMLLAERTISGIAVDTLSLDHGSSKDFKTHHAWLPAGRWGLENVANLAKLPARGATLVVGAPKIKGATGGPARLLALV